MAASKMLAIATYNEIENLPDLVDKLLQIEDLAILVIDDGSPDGTGAWVDRASSENSRIQAIHRSGKLGLGSATVRGMEAAIHAGAEYLFTMDADFSHHPDDLPKLIARITSSSDVDVVIGSRYVEGGKIIGWPLIRRLMSKLVNWYARRLLKLPVKDCSGAFRGYRVEILKKIQPSSLKSQGYSYLEEILWRILKEGGKMVEVPIVFRDRTRGKTKINSREAFRALRIIFSMGVFGRP